jgi:ABC-2 type transport system permease protein
MLLAATGGVLTAVVGSSEYHLTLTAATILELAGVLLIGAATWASIGTAVSTLIPTVEAAWPLLGLTYLPSVILSGSFGSVGGEPRWLTTVVGYLPVQPVIHGVAHVLHVSGAGAPMGGRDLAVLAVWGLGGLLLAQRSFRWEPRWTG